MSDEIHPNPLSTDRSCFREAFENSRQCSFILERMENSLFPHVEVNSAFEHIAGLISADLIGKTIDETASVETADIMNELSRSCLLACTTIGQNVLLDLPTGRRWYHLTLIPIRGEAGLFNRIAGDIHALAFGCRITEICQGQYCLSKFPCSSSGLNFTLLYTIEGNMSIPYIDSGVSCFNVARAQDFPSATFRP